jgi:AraC-like DNA-binding protein
MTRQIYRDEALAPPGSKAGEARSVIDAGYVNLVMSGIRQSGRNVDHVLVRAGLDPLRLSEPNARLSQPEFARLISVLTRTTRDEFWSLCSRPIKPGTFRTMCKLLVQCSSLREAVKTGCQFYHLVVDDFTIRFREDNKEGCIWVTDTIIDPERRRMINGAIVFFIYGLMCWLVGRKLPLTTVHYVFPEQPFSSELEPFYNAPLLYDQTRTELRFEADILDLPIMPDEERLRRYLASVPSVLLVRYRDESSFSERVRAILRRNLTKHLSLEDVAAMLAVSPQTLRRRLQDDDSSGFQELKDQVRRDVAIHLLQKSRLSLEEIALSLGFSELSTFHRAFRRWTGVAPGEFRQTGSRPAA